MKKECSRSSPYTHSSDHKMKGEEYTLEGMFISLGDSYLCLGELNKSAAPTTGLFRVHTGQQPILIESMDQLEDVTAKYNVF